MANLGTIAEVGCTVKSNTGQAPPPYLRKITCGDRDFALGGISNTEGNLATPSLRLDVRGCWRLRWRVRAGARTIQVNVKQECNQSPRPRLTILASPQIGILADISTSAASSTGWVTIGPVTITPTASGAVWVKLEAMYDAASGIPTFFDHIATT